MTPRERQERRYALSMASMCVDRGFVNLAQSYLVAAKDCPAGCECKGCEQGRSENAERKLKMARQARGIAA